MIDHISVGVSDLERSARFYEATLAPLGLSRLVTRPATVGFGKAHPEFWINLQARYDLDVADRTSRRRIEQEVKPRAA